MAKGDLDLGKLEDEAEKEQQKQVKAFLPLVERLQSRWGTGEGGGA